MPDGLHIFLCYCTEKCAIAHFSVQWQTRKQHRYAREGMASLRTGGSVRTSSGAASRLQMAHSRSYADVADRKNEGIESPWGGKTLCLSHCGYTSGRCCILPISRPVRLWLTRWT